MSYLECHYENIMQLALRILFIPILISFISLGQTNDNPRKLILQKWKLEEVSIRPAIKQRIKTLRKTDPKKAQQVEDSFETMVKAAQSTVYEYFEDGTYKTKVMLMSEKANWQILADNKTLILKSEKLGEFSNFSPRCGSPCPAEDDFHPLTDKSFSY